ncbi:hypothetical protein [Maridesulfovibrio ferrireducens]|uniref:hypothetical protein n=1 Tax=Maridesulfovibrio ferrireducens TaxID=246191 RepID=UPI001A2ED45D|nr:hypothetical protein [Maridesulfovibrio ferrireducens]MBI9113279.1 hypothetical protein [Maridesulfovibrio ferrireducens]
MPTLSIRKVPADQLEKLKSLAKERGVPYNSVEELLRIEIAKLAGQSSDLPLKLYMTPALPLHYIAEKEDGSRWLILSTSFGPQSWSNATEYKGNYTLERLPDYMAKLFLPDV